MTIRFTCAGCGSLLKIKDDLAGTDGKCPKCKSEFVVPSAEPGADSAEVDIPKADPSKKERPKNEAVRATGKGDSPTDGPEAAKKTAKSPKPGDKPKKPAKDSDEFDPTEFLMGDDGGGPRKPSFTVPSLDEPESRPAPPENRPNRPASKPVATSGSAASRSDGANASSNAKELMMKAMEESRLHASEHHEEKEPGFDYAGMFRELGVKGVGSIVGVIIIAVGVYFLMDYMMGGSLRLPPLGYVTGTVTLDGKPLPGVMVFFEPKDVKISGGKEKPRTSLGTTDDKGQYTMIYIDQIKGVGVGKARVWLSLVGPNGQQVIPPELTDGALTVKEVKSGNQVIDFPLQSAPGQPAQ